MFDNEFLWNFNSYCKHICDFITSNLLISSVVNSDFVFMHPLWFNINVLKMILHHIFDWRYLWMLSWYWKSNCGLSSPNYVLFMPFKSDFVKKQLFSFNFNSVKIIQILRAKKSLRNKKHFDRLKIAKEWGLLNKIGLQLHK